MTWSKFRLSTEVAARLEERLLRLYGEDAGRCLARLELLLSRYDHIGTDHVRRELAEDATVLITYGGSVRAAGERPLVALRRFLEERLVSAFSTVHILPFFPYSSDDGFSVIHYRKVDPELGGWSDVEAIGERFDLAFDLVLNHISSKSQWFRDFVSGIAPARDFFICVDPETDLSAVVRPRTSPLLRRVQTLSGDAHVWTTFSADQVDLNFANPDVLFEFLDTLLYYVSKGMRIVRLDAVAFLWKRIGTSCLHLPETHEVVKLMRDVAEAVAPGTIILTETNVPHAENVSYFGAGDEAHMVYQFPLAPLLLHALHSGSVRHLREWAASLAPPPPRCTFLNFTASHDGIGVRPLEGLVPEDGLDLLVRRIVEAGGRVSMKQNSDGSASPYELNCTYFDACGDGGTWGSDSQIARFLCTQTVAMSLQGVPAVYIHSLTATRNDYEGAERAGYARALNRKAWDAEELEALLADESSVTARVFREYTRRLQLRREQSAFHPAGRQVVLELGDSVFGIRRSCPRDSQTIVALANMTDETCSVQLDDAACGGRDPVGGVDLLGAGASTDGATITLPAHGCCWFAFHDSDRGTRPES